jgi:nucleoside-diphosphate-sugar epimerase
MRVFITGATGFIGSAVVDELIGAGHIVIGLARSDQAEKQLLAAGASVQRGSLEDLASLKRAAAESEGVIHLAFVHDFANFATSCAKDQAAIEALGSVLSGSNRALVVSSGVLGLAQDRPGTEEDVPAHGFPRKSEETALSFVPLGVRASVVRLSPSVHGDGDHGFVPQLIKGARSHGFSAYIGEGKNRWPAVHRLDAARLYRLALEKGSAGGRYHGVAEEGVPIRDIAQAIGKRLSVPTVSKSAEDVVSALGFVGHVLGMDATSSSKLTQERLGWLPTQPGLLDDLERGTYFDAD